MQASQKELLHQVTATTSCFLFFFQSQCEVFTGYCVRISTGAVVPPGADAVVPVEDTELMKDSDGGKTELKIKILKAPAKNQFIRHVICIHIRKIVVNLHVCIHNIYFVL